MLQSNSKKGYCKVASVAVEDDTNAVQVDDDDIELQSINNDKNSSDKTTHSQSNKKHNKVRAPIASPVSTSDTPPSSSSSSCCQRLLICLLVSIVTITFSLSLYSYGLVSHLSTSTSSLSSSSSMCHESSFVTRQMLLLKSTPLRTVITDDVIELLYEHDFQPSGMVVTASTVVMTFSSTSYVLSVPVNTLLSQVMASNDIATRWLSPSSSSSSSSSSLSSSKGYDGLFVTFTEDTPAHVPPVQFLPLTAYRISTNSSSSSPSLLLFPLDVPSLSSPPSSSSSSSSSPSIYSEGPSCPVSVMNDMISGLNVANYAGKTNYWTVCQYTNCDRTPPSAAGPPTIKVFKMDTATTCPTSYSLQLHKAEVSFVDYTFTTWTRPSNYYYLTLLGSSSGSVWVGQAEVEAAEFNDAGLVYELPRNRDCQPLFCHVLAASFVAKDVLLLATGAHRSGDPPSCYLYEQSIHAFHLPKLTRVGQ